MSERYTMRTATYEPTLYMDNGSILSDEQVLDLLNQLSTVTAQRDAANEELHATTFDVAHWRTVAECLQVERDRLKKERDAAVEALKVADAWFTEQDDNDTHAEVVRAAIAAAGETP